MLNFKKKRITRQKNQKLEYIQIILLQFKIEYAQCLLRAHVTQYNIKSKLY